jgi:hypothetical protein
MTLEVAILAGTSPLSLAEVHVEASEAAALRWLEARYGAAPVRFMSGPGYVEYHVGRHHIAQLRVREGRDLRTPWLMGEHDEF